MARLIDADVTDQEETTGFDNLNEEATEDTGMEASESQEATEERQGEDDLPEKYKGKTAAEIARMHRELEQRMGQQSQEVGELRKAFDEMVKTSIQAQQSPAAPEEAEVDDIDFFADPKAAVAKAVENHPTLRQAQAVAAEMAKSQSLAKLQQAHPDMKEIVTKDDFREWVNKSPYRQQMFAQADQQYDFGAANELLTLYKERAAVVQETSKLEKVAQKQAVKNASTGSARSTAQGSSPKKIYRRADIIELMKTNPKRYEALQGEIMKAYAEGRVK